MTILQISKYCFLTGGTDKIFLDTVDLLKKYGEEVYCFCLKSPNNLPYEEDCYFVNYPKFSTIGFWQKIKRGVSFFYNFDAKKKIEKLILNKKPDVAHIHTLFNGISVSILPVLRKYRIPIVMTLHDYRLLCPVCTLLDGKGKICERCKNRHYFQCIVSRCSRRGWIIDLALALEMYFQKIFYSSFKYVDQFIFVSRFAFKKYASFHIEYEKKGTLLYNFVRKREKFFIGKGKQFKEYFLYYGRLSHEKGVLTLLEAIKGLNILLKIVGNGSVLNSFSSKLPSNVELLGFKSGESLREIIWKAYFVIVPSEWYEVFGLTALEPQIEGVPVIGARIGAIPELIIDGENGFLFEAGNVKNLRQIIKKALNLSEREYNNMVFKSKRRGMNFSDQKKTYYSLMSVYLSAKRKCHIKNS